MTTHVDFSTAILIRVDQSGNGDFRKIQDAIDAVPSNNSELVFILVKPGTYRFFLCTLASSLKFNSLYWVSFPKLDFTYVAN